MEKMKFRARVSKETWSRLQAVLQYIDKKGAVTVPPLCIACPDTTGGQVFALHEVGAETRYSSHIPKDGKWLHQTLRAMEGRMQEEFQALKDERLEREAAATAAKAVAAFQAAMEAAEVEVYETEIHVIVRRTSRIPRKNTALPGGSTWKWSEMKALLKAYGPLSKAELLGLLTMEGREASEARMEASFASWLTRLSAEGKITWDAFDNVSLS